MSVTVENTYVTAVYAFWQMWGPVAFQGRLARAARARGHVPDLERECHMTHMMLTRESRRRAQMRTQRPHHCHFVTF